MKRQDIISTVDDEPKSTTKVTKWKQIENSLILNQLDQMIDSEELLLPEDVTYRCCLESIKLVGPEKSVILSEGMIISAEQKLKSQLIRRELIFNQQELNFYNKNDELRHMVKEFCKKKRCTIEVIQSKISSKNLTASTLSYEGKEMNIVYAEISQFPCDAIVNSCNNILSLRNVVGNLKVYLKAFVESFDPKVIDDVQNLIQKELNKKKTDCFITLPLFKEADFNELKNYIERKSLQPFEGLENGKKVRIQLFQNQLSKVSKYFEMFKENKFKFPEQWIPQDKNSIKVELPNDSKEYKEIEVEFQKTDQGKIFKIYRLQNQTLWENYQSEKERLLNIYRQRNTSLTQLEQERYLWHGVKGQHPKIIYESMKEAFDITYSNIGMWGPGIYFAEKAINSRDYSYKLTQQDDPIHTGKRVFLCCKVATGRIHTCNSDSTIKRPPAGYDCVNGFTNGSNVFILYGAETRRAYPAYEIIYE